MGCVRCSGTGETLMEQTIGAGEILVHEPNRCTVTILDEQRVEITQKLRQRTLPLGQALRLRAVLLAAGGMAQLTSPRG